MGIQEKNGYKWFVPDYPFKNLPLGDWEKKEREWILKNVPHGGLFIDVGANLGIYAITLANHFDEVIALEPQPINVEILKKNIELNRINNIIVLDKAGWDESKAMMVLQLLPDDLASASIATDNEKQVGEMKIDSIGTPMNKVCVEGIRIDDLQTKPNFVKIDVEGGEFHVLKGMEDTMKRCAPTILVEMHHQEHTRMIIEWMRERGYDNILQELPTMPDKFIFQKPK